MSNQIGTLKMGQKFKKTPVGEIPVEWNVQRISDIGDVITGATPSTTNQSFWGGNIPFVTPSDIKGSRYVNATGRYVTALGLESVRKISKDTIMFTCIASIGKMALSLKECCTNQQINSIVCHSNIDPKYLFYALANKIETIKGMAGKTAVPIINKSLFGEIELPVPAMPEQKRISNVLWGVDDLIEAIQYEMEAIKKLKKGLMRQLLTRGIGHKKFKKTEIGEIPESWSLVSFADVFTFLRNGSNSRDELSDSGDVGYVHYGDLHTKWQTKLDCSKVELPKIEAKLVGGLPFLENGDLIIADASEDYAGVGVSVEVSNVEEQKIIAGLHTMLLRDKTNTFVDGFRGYIQYIPAVHDSLIKVATGGSVYGISKSNVQSVKIPCPPHKEQEQIRTILAELDFKLQNQETYLEKVAGLKKSLMSVLLTGKVRV